MKKSNRWKRIVKGMVSIMILTAILHFSLMANQYDLPPKKGDEMQLTSSVFSNGESIPSLYTCEGKNINPPLFIANVPKGAKSLVLIVDDPDVPPAVRADRMWDHWIVFNIPPTVTDIEENSTPPGIPGRNSSGQNEYQGPCPPDREHRYFFKLYALNQTLSLPPGSSKKEVEAAMKGHIIEECQLMGRYDKKARKKP